MGSINIQQSLDKLCQPLWVDLPGHTKTKPGILALDQGSIDRIQEHFEIYVRGKPDPVSKESVRQFSFERKRAGFLGFVKRIWLRLRRFHAASTNEKLLLHDYIAKFEEKTIGPDKPNTFTFLHEVLEKCFLKTSGLGQKILGSTPRPSESSAGKMIKTTRTDSPEHTTESSESELSKLEKRFVEIFDKNKGNPTLLRNAIMREYLPIDLLSLYQKSEQLQGQTSTRPLILDVLVAQARQSQDNLSSVMDGLRLLKPTDEIRVGLHELPAIGQPPIDFAHVDASKLTWRNKIYADFGNIRGKGLEFEYESISNANRRCGALGDYHVILEAYHAFPEPQEKNKAVKTFISSLNSVELLWLYEIASKDQEKHTQFLRDFQEIFADKVRSSDQKQLLVDYLKKNALLYPEIHYPPFLKQLLTPQIEEQLGAHLGAHRAFPEIPIELPLGEPSAPPPSPSAPPPSPLAVDQGDVTGPVPVQIVMPQDVPEVALKPIPVTAPSMASTAPMSLQQQVFQWLQTESEPSVLRSKCFAVPPHELVLAYKQAQELPSPQKEKLHNIVKELVVFKGRFTHREGENIEDLQNILQLLEEEKDVQQLLSNFFASETKKIDFPHVDAAKLAWKNKTFSDFPHLNDDGLRFNAFMVLCLPERCGELGDYQLIVRIYSEFLRKYSLLPDWKIVPEKLKLFNIVEYLWLYELAEKLSEQEGKEEVKNGIRELIVNAAKDPEKKKDLATYYMGNKALYQNIPDWLSNLLQSSPPVPSPVEEPKISPAPQPTVPPQDNRAWYSTIPGWVSSFFWSNQPAPSSTGGNLASQPHVASQLEKSGSVPLTSTESKPRAEPLSVSSGSKVVLAASQLAGQGQSVLAKTTVPPLERSSGKSITSKWQQSVSTAQEVAASIPPSSTNVRPKGNNLSKLKEKLAGVNFNVPPGGAPRPGKPRDDSPSGHVGVEPPAAEARLESPTKTRPKPPKGRRPPARKSPKT